MLIVELRNVTSTVESATSATPKANALIFAPVYVPLWRRRTISEPWAPFSVQPVAGTPPSRFAVPPDTPSVPLIAPV